MRTRWIITLSLFVTAVPAFAQRVYVDFDSATPFSRYRTFQIHEIQRDLQSFSQTSHRRVLEALRQYAQEGGLEEVASDPDVYVAYYTADGGDLRLALSSLEYAYGPDFSLGSYWAGGVGTRTPDAFTFKEGTLVIDVWDAREKRLVWRGMATSAVPKDPDKIDKRIAKAIKKITKDWEDLYGARVRALRKHQAGEK